MQLIYGINPLLEGLRGRGRTIKKVVIASGKGGNPIREILDLAGKAGIPVEFRDRDFLDRQSGGRTHQGVIGFIEDFAYVSVDDIIANRHRESKKDLILILDGVTDPQNLGSLIRTAHCFGANGVIIPKNRSASVTATVMKTSSGTAGLTPIAMEANLSQTIEYLQSRSFWVYGAAAKEGLNIHTLDYGEHVAVVMGSEGQGIRSLIRRKCDFLVSIPMKGKIDSLNVSVAAGIILYEISRVWDKS
jgi:23S rRNA (guanosine2251-2'-O)-methyltransferase